MLTTVPDDPPSAGPDRALDPPLPAAGADGDVTAADGVPHAAQIPITALISTPAMIHLRLLRDSRRTTSTGSPDLAFETGRVGAFSRWLVGSGPVTGMRKEWRPFISGWCGRTVRGL